MLAWSRMSAAPPTLAVQLPRQCRARNCRRNPNFWGDTLAQMGVVGFVPAVGQLCKKFFRVHNFAQGRPPQPPPVFQSNAYYSISYKDSLGSFLQFLRRPSAARRTPGALPPPSRTLSPFPAFSNRIMILKPGGSAAAFLPPGRTAISHIDQNQTKTKPTNQTNQTNQNQTNHPGVLAPSGQIQCPGARSWPQFKKSCHFLIDPAWHGGPAPR